MFIKAITMLSTIASALVLSACGGAEQDAAPHLLAASAADLAPAAAAASGSATAPAKAAAPAPAPLQSQAGAPLMAQSTSDAARTLLWEQSISLEMNRRHEEQLATASSATSQPDTM